LLDSICLSLSRNDPWRGKTGVSTQVAITRFSRVRGWNTGGSGSEEWADAGQGDIWSCLIEILDDSDRFWQKSGSRLTGFFPP
jgi:hypothetical protein